MKSGIQLPPYLAALGLTLLLSLSAVAHGDEIALQRDLFRKATAAQASGRTELARQYARELSTYALYPYLRYYELQRRLQQWPEVEIAEFLATYENSYLAERLRREWLTRLARAQKWALFVRDYRTQEDVTLQCQHLTARIKTERLDGVLDEAKALWLVGISRPEACDPAFTVLYRSALMSDDLIWQRIRLAMAAGNAGLARYTAAKLRDPAGRARFDLWWMAQQDPAALLRRHELADTPAGREIAVHALGRLARLSIERARVAWLEISQRLRFSEDEAAQYSYALALAAAASNHAERIALLDAVPAAKVDDAILRYRLREGIGQQAWEPLSRWTAGPAPTDEDPLRWRYWHSQALTHLGRHAEARGVLEALASERDYYGFLAADKIGKEYAFNFVPVAATAEESASMVAIPGIERARELSALNMKFESRREWTHELKRMSRRQLEVAAAAAAAWGWPDLAIMALGQAESYDDLQLRFPLLHTELALQQAAQRRLDPARVLAIIRAESAFAIDARSPVGALGLMQVMPQTGLETARHAGVRLTDPSMLLQPQANIAIGTVYLQRMLARFNGNFAMAAAAYNAGPDRVRQWQSDQCIPAERWVDSIPFTETRSYVRRALFYAAIYQWRLQRPIDKFADVMAPIPPRGSSGTAGCTT